VQYWLDHSSRGVASATTLLPVHAYQAAGGTSNTAIPLAAYWVLALLAARILDDVQDQEGADRLWNTNGVLAGIPFGTAALTAANLCLTFLDVSSGIRTAVERKLHGAVLIAARAQSREPRDMQLGTYFSNAIGSSGLAFGAIACAGGQLVTGDEDTLKRLHDIGYHVGMRDAVRSDCADLEEDLERGIFTLPVIYAKSLHTHPLHYRLTHLLAGQKLSCNEIEDIQSILVKMDAITWSVQVSDRFHEKAVTNLRELDPYEKSNLWRYVRKQP
jgi:geranylgeranyl pyrophosphate synthase